MVINSTLIILFIALITLIVLFNSTWKKSNNNYLYRSFAVLVTFFIIYVFGMGMQILCSDTKVPPVYFEYFAYIGGMCFPTAIFIMACTYFNGNKKLDKLRVLYIIPIVLLVILWTNDLHHLFYKEYSIYLSSSQFGPVLNYFTVYSYALLAIAYVLIFAASIKRSGFVSRQTAIILLGLITPTLANVIGVFDSNLNITVYVTPILLTVTSLCFYIAIFKLKALNVVPIATKTIIDSMTDSFMVLSEDGTIVDLNKTCENKFKPIVELKQNANFYEALCGNSVGKLGDVKKDIQMAFESKETINKEYHIVVDGYDRYFDTDIQPIKAKTGNEYVAVLLLIRDVTQEKKDIEIMTKNENLVILGELAGGVAHDINTPISAIKSGITMLKPMSRNDDETMLLNSMDSCADKIIALVNSLRNQIRNIGSDSVTDIDITNVLKDIKLILNNELKKNNVTLDVVIEDNIHISGNSTKLSQVITNIITNAIQAYEGKGGKVEVILKKYEDSAVISVKDYASGIPERVRPYIFKNILTTKGVSGTGFGLYLAYSVIKGAFGGDITFETETGKGTTFFISVPLK